MSDQKILSVNEKDESNIFCFLLLEPFILWSYDIWSWYVHSESRKIDATENKENGIV